MGRLSLSAGTEKDLGHNGRNQYKIEFQIFSWYPGWIEKDSLKFK
jgi:hypothetical protein